MSRKLLLGAAAAIMLAGCSGEDVTTSSQDLIEPENKDSELPDPESYHNSIKAVMAEVPPSMKIQFQKLFICEVRRNNMQAQPKPVDADYLRALADYLEANPTAGENCTL